RLKPVDRAARGRGEHRIDGPPRRGELASSFDIHSGRFGTELGEERAAAVEIRDEPGGEVTGGSSNAERAMTQAHAVGESAGDVTPAHAPLVPDAVSQPLRGFSRCRAGT